MYATLTALAALWGAATGILLPRPAYRLSVDPGDPWRTTCPAGHPFTGAARGWLGIAKCPACETAGSEAAGSGRTGATRTPVDDSGDLGDSGAVTAQPDAAPASAPEGLVDTEPDTGPGTGPDTGPEPDGTPDASLVRYAPSLLVPVLGALGCAALAAATGARPELAVWLLLAPVALLLSLVDRNVHRLPDHLTLPLALAAAVLLGVAALVPGAGGSWTGALLGGLVLGGCYFVLFLINPRGMGFGDVKLALSLGVLLGWYGWAVLFLGAFAGLALGGLYGLGLVILRRAGRKSVMPFGPFMIAGALLGLLLGGLTAG
ncbi:prepilin peptidase [Streptomyces sp. NPDC093085]|uniref:prepilin peptidase n=1 Tax=Streptomyces sp. NPDC093085 TaxID=3155068 RepID=UPI0034149881